MAMALVVDDHHRDNLAEFAQAVDKVISSHDDSRVAFDCEGVNLSRVGTVELVAICFEEPVCEKTTVFLVDLNNEKQTRNLQERVATLKRLLESPDTVKVIHDCRMDSDVLYHKHGIRLQNVHDTSCFHAIQKGTTQTSLNDMLLYNGVPQNNVREKSIYKQNPRYWATRPITNQMIEWSSSDVDKLLSVASKQTLSVKSRGKYKEAMGASSAYAAFARDMNIETGVVCLCHVGGFIGRRGANIQSVQNRTGTLVYSEHTANKFMIYYRDRASLNAVKRAMGHSV